MKRPSFQFYPSDWLRDTALRSCSTGARGLWIDMICFMHDGTPYGHLKVGGKVILPDNLARMVGETLPQVRGWLDELHQAGVFDLGEDGQIICRRMIRDEKIRNARAAGGKLGGNPLLLSGKVNLPDNVGVNLDVNEEVGLEDKQKTTPSSSSSSSSSKEKKTLQQAVAKPEEVPDQVWEDWLALRKSKKAPVTPTVLQRARKEAGKAKMSLADFLEIWCSRGWQSCEADWILPKGQPPVPERKGL